jgi:hypothetical protein
MKLATVRTAGAIFLRKPPILEKSPGFLHSDFVS